MFLSLLQDPQPRPERRCALVDDGSAGQDRDPRLARLPGEPGERRCLPDPRLPAEEHKTAATRRGDIS